MAKSITIVTREQLTGLGSSFHTDSDAEVLLEAFSRWGLDSLRVSMECLRLRSGTNTSEL
jgi:asparagine synthetase B (glutamine-hydrolysing)